MGRCGGTWAIVGLAACVPASTTPSTSATPTELRCPDDGPRPRFEDVSARAGLPALTVDPWVSQGPTDCAQIEDLDGDGVADLIYLWHGGLHVGWGRGDLTFEDVAFPMNGGTEGCLVVDLDGDGARDVLVPRAGSGSVWLRQSGPRVLEDVSQAAGLADVAASSRAAAALDFDHDGDLDLFVGGRAEPYPPWNCHDLDGDHVHCDAATALLDSPDHFLEQRGGVFVERGPELGMNGRRGSGLAAATFDTDGDGSLDLLVGNDFDANELYATTPLALVSLDDAEGLDAYNHAMGIGLFDYDLDGQLDFLVSEVGGDVLYHREGTRFVERSREAHVSQPTADHYAWGVAVADFDADGDEDALVATSYVAADERLIEMMNAVPSGQSGGSDATAILVGAYAGAQGDDLFVNCGDGTFEHALLPTRLTPGTYRSETPASTGDLDGDGRMDLFVNGEGAGLRLLHNVTPGGHAIELVLHGRTEPEAIGAIVRVTSGGRTQVRVRQVGSAGGHPGAVLHVGLGASTTADVEVRWPDGTRTSLVGVPAGAGVLPIVQP